MGAFVAGNCLEYVTGAIPFPLELRGNEVQFADAVKKRAIGIRLIYNSLEESFQNQFLEHLENHQITLMWAKFKSFDRARDVVYAARIKDAFNEVVFDPANMTIQDVITRLENARLILSNSPQRINDNDVLQRLLASLPLDSTKWDFARDWCRRQNLSLQDTIAHLKSKE